jgi:hypothetical protein
VLVGGVEPKETNGHLPNMQMRAKKLTAVIVVDVIQVPGAVKSAAAICWPAKPRKGAIIGGRLTTVRWLVPGALFPQIMRAVGSILCPVSTAPCHRDPTKTSTPRELAAGPPIRYSAIAPC